MDLRGAGLFFGPPRPSRTACSWADSNRKGCCFSRLDVPTDYLAAILTSRDRLGPGPSAETSKLALLSSLLPFALCPT